ncbi:MAG: MltA domain-containing protein [Pseudomonadota bacterium]
MTSRLRLKARWAWVVAAAAWLAACATPPEPATPPTPTVDPGLIQPEAPPRPTEFSQLPAWPQIDPGPAMRAFKRSCAVWENWPEDALVSARATYAGRVSDWRSVCAAAEVAGDAASGRLVVEALFRPVEIDPAGQQPRFTGYFEPEIEARRTPQPPFTEPIRAVPSDLVPRPGSGRPQQRLVDGSLRPYPARADITASSGPAIGYARVSDVFFLQIQGSGRLRFADGGEIRAAYGAHNGRPFRSVANWLIQQGEITRGEASIDGLSAWMETSDPRRVREALNQNPRYVFFQAKPLDDPSLGPAGAQGVPLTPLGSMAVDPAYHPLGAPMFVTTSAPGLGGDWAGLVVAQDTGGAIKGPVRGDLYFGTGADAGARASTVNAPGRLWVLLPRAVAARLAPSS